MLTLSVSMDYEYSLLMITSTFEQSSYHILYLYLSNLIIILTCRPNYSLFVFTDWQLLGGRSRGVSDVKRVTDFIMRGEGMKGVKRSKKRSRSDDCIPSLSTAFSSVSHPCDISSPPSPCVLQPKKSRLSI